MSTNVADLVSVIAVSGCAVGAFTSVASWVYARTHWLQPHASAPVATQIPAAATAASEATPQREPGSDVPASPGAVPDTEALDEASAALEHAFAAYADQLQKQTEDQARDEFERRLARLRELAKTKPKLPRSSH